MLSCRNNYNSNNNICSEYVAEHSKIFIFTSVCKIGNWLNSPALFCISFMREKKAYCARNPDVLDTDGNASSSPGTLCSRRAFVCQQNSLCRQSLTIVQTVFQLFRLCISSWRRPRLRTRLIPSTFRPINMRLLGCFRYRMWMERTISTSNWNRPVITLLVAFSR